MKYNIRSDEFALEILKRTGSYSLAENKLNRYVKIWDVLVFIPFIIIGPAEEMNTLSRYVPI